MNDPIENPTFSLHVKNMVINPKPDYRHSDAAVKIELSQIKVRTLIQQLEAALKENKGSIHIKFSGTRGTF